MKSDYTPKQVKSSNNQGASAASDLPCLNSNISIENTKNWSKADLSTQHRKSAFVLKLSVEKMAQKYGLEHLGFLTLTFADDVQCHKQAQKRFNSLKTHVLKVRYLDHVGVKERQKSGRLHYHLLVALKKDIRTNIDFEEFSLGNYKSASKALRSEWTYWRDTSKKYKFGRTELLPIKSNTEAIAKYVGKYIAKHIENRNFNDKGARLTIYSKGSKAGNTRMSFVSDGSTHWRRKIAVFAQIVQTDYPDTPINNISDFTKVLGKNWAYRHRDFILNLP